MTAGLAARVAPGQRMFLGAAVGLVLFGLVHSLAVYNANFGPPRSAADAELHQLMRDLQIQVGPMRSSAWGAVQILNASYSVLLLYVGTLNLLVLETVAVHGKLRALTVANLVFTGLLLVITIAYQFPPPMVFAVIVFVLFALSLYQQRRGTKRRA